MKKFIFTLCALFCLSLVGVNAQTTAKKSCKKVCADKAKTTKVASAVMTADETTKMHCSKMSKEECKKMTKADCQKVCPRGKSKMASSFKVLDDNKVMTVGKKIKPEKSLYKKKQSKGKVAKA